MGKLAKRKRKNAPVSETVALHSLKQAQALSSTVSNTFVRDRISDYTEFAVALADQLGERAKEGSNDNAFDDELKDGIEYFGKMARRLDLIFSVSHASGYLSARDRAIVHSVRVSVEKKLEAFAEKGKDGLFSFCPQSPGGGLRIRMHSRFGRWLAGIMGRKEMPSTESKDAQTTLKEIMEPVVKELSEAKADFDAGRLDGAIGHYKTILKSDPNNVDALYGLGTSYRRAGTAWEALGPLEKAQSLCSSSTEVLLGYSYALLEVEDYEKALTLLQTALRQTPDDLALLVATGFCLHLKGDDEKSFSSFEKALALSPNSADVLCQLGIYYHNLGNFDKAFNYFARAVKAAPKNAMAVFGYGILLGQLRKTEQALDFLDKALAIEPGNVNFLYNKAFLYLASGQYEKGWELYEYGLIGNGKRKVAFLPGRPVWKGEAIDDKKLLILNEQGLGDAIQFLRYAAMCKERAREVFVLCPKPLVRLFEACPYIDKVFSVVDSRAYDVQIPMMSLPHIFGTTLETVPSNVPYFTVPQDILKRWGSKIVAAQGKTKVGLVWSGSRFSGEKRGDLCAERRNIDLKLLAPLLDLENVAFFNLQMEKGKEQIAALGLQDKIVDPMDGVEDMLDTAAIIEHLDLVISVDTSVAHLAGALGKPVWVLSRFDACWRWLHNRPTSPWYPTARVFDQPKSLDWTPVVKDVVEALKGFEQKQAIL
ncbi:MAG: tetratricopeptide repeat protein [Alphaproteobacteria bacterium]|nr:tetratricopeptide repeat protein [Alphaproteobacteria bacterium]